MGKNPIEHEEGKRNFINFINNEFSPKQYTSADFSFVPPQKPDTIRINDERLFYSLADKLGIEKIGKIPGFGISRPSVGGGLSYVLEPKDIKQTFDRFLDGCVAVCLDKNRTDEFYGIMRKEKGQYNSSKEFIDMK